MSVLLLGLFLMIGIVVFFILLGTFTSGTGADVLDWNPAKRAERQAELDHNDFEDMLEVNNRIRRERGLPELVEEDVRAGRMSTARPAPLADGE